MINFIKSSFKINCKNGTNDVRIDDVNGYIFEYDGVLLGCDKRFNNMWFITHLKSGISLGRHARIRGEVEDVLKELELHTNKSIQELLKNGLEKCVEHCNTIRKAYELDENTNMLENFENFI